ncbi:MAG: hypothetical protein J6A88_03650 [Oscillospiraceae bacterium]|nr:hypothetical protein [Oscillospiraceae bacterium]
MINAINDSANIQKAKAILKRYRLLSLLIGWGIPMAFLVIYFANRRFDVFIIGMIISAFAMRVWGRKLHRKMIMGALLDDRNTPLFYQLMYQGKAFNESGIPQIQAEYSVGNFGNVIPACRKKLADAKCFKKYKYAYLSLLAHCYFVVGDDGKLKEICDWYSQCLAVDKKKVKAPNQLTIFDYFNAYLNRDTDTCVRYLSRNAINAFMQTELDFERARLLLLKGENEAAKTLFAQIAASAPMTNYGLLSKQAVATMDAGEPYGAAFADFTENADYAVMPPSKAATVSKVVRIACFTFSALCIIALIVVNLLPGIRESDYRKELQSIISSDYGQVEIIEMFNLEKGDEVVDSMFIAMSEENIIVGCTYWYENDDTMYYDVQVEKKISSFKNRPYESCYFICKTSPYSGKGFFCNDSSYIPKDAYYTVSFRLDGKTYYFVIDEVSVSDWFEISCP